MDANEPGGDQWVRRLYEARAAGLMLYGRALGLSHSEAEDVLQDTFVAMLALRVPPANPAHYCVRAFRNRALNWRRGVWRRLTRELESRRWFEAGEQENPQERRAQRLLESLPRAQREVIVLRIWHGCTLEEIGGLTGVSANTVAGRYRYGLERLRRAMNGGEDEIEPTVGGVPGCVGSAASVGGA